VVTALAPVGAAVPSNPTAATRVAAGADDTYITGDGTVKAFITMTVPAKPANAVWQNVLLKRAGAAEYMVVAQNNASGSVTVRIDDLEPGISYDVATQAWSGAGASAIVGATASPFTAPTRTTSISAPSGGGLTTDGVIPKYFPGTLILAAGSRAFWDPVSDAQYAYTEIKATLTNSDAATDYSWSSLESGSSALIRTRDPSVCVYLINALFSGHVRVRHVSKSGVATAWAYVGNAQSNWSLGAGNITKQNDNDVLVSGFKIGSGSGAAKTLAHRPFVVFPTLAGGSPQEDVNVNLTGYGFTSRPESCTAQLIDSPYPNVRISYRSGTSTSTNALLWVQTTDGSNLPNALIGISGFFSQF
jgi:hypothetical protein